MQKKPETVEANSHLCAQYNHVDRKTVLKMWLNLGISLTIFRGTGPWPESKTLSLLKRPVYRH